MSETGGRNPGTSLERGWFEDVQVNRSAAERRAAGLAASRTVKKQYQAAWLLRAIQCIDLTTLAGDDTPGRVRRLCNKARQPVRQDILDELGVGDMGLTTGAVCVYPTMVPHAVKALAGTGIPVASVATGFPPRLTPLEQRLGEIRYAVEQGAREIDIVVTRQYPLLGEWQALHDEIRAMREACGEAKMKAILATGELVPLPLCIAHRWWRTGRRRLHQNSTGKETENATLPVSLVMLRALRDYRDRTGHQVGFKPVGGLRTAKDAMNWLALMEEELGGPWMEPGLFRIGASSLLADIERQLEHHVTGRYASAAHHALS